MKKPASSSAATSSASRKDVFPPIVQSENLAGAFHGTSLEAADGDRPDVSLTQLGRVPIGDTDNLNETVLGSAAVGNPDAIPPEVVQGTETLTEWDEPADAAGTWTPREGLDDGVPDAARLYEAGVEEADRERRMAANATEE